LSLRGVNIRWVKKSVGGNIAVNCGFRLLDVLAMRCEEKGISGQILVDGRKRPKYFKCVTGYVVQVNIIIIITVVLCCFVLATKFSGPGKALGRVAAYMCPDDNF